jgi:ABC-type multidrug transport system fused ATPase/permease subunit
MKGRTTIVIAHRLSTIIHANKIITLMDGQIAEEGTHDQLVHAKNGIYARFFAMQNGKQSGDKPVEKLKAKRAAKGAPK